ncbi:MAG: DUF4162 domain-containing protein, partial [Chitinophagales bacterium]|nr:DUF4162 domain-containing protein [Chitinophagales bacterium]
TFRVVFEGTLPEKFSILYPEYTLNNNELTLKLADSSSQKLLMFLLEHNVKITSFYEIFPTLQEIFIKAVEQKAV